jgi:hypothetical protein
MTQKHFETFNVRGKKNVFYLAAHNASSAKYQPKQL